MEEVLVKEVGVVVDVGRAMVVDQKWAVVFDSTHMFAEDDTDTEQVGEKGSEVGEGQ